MLPLVVEKEETQILELPPLFHQVHPYQVLLPEKPAWLAWLGSDTAWFSRFSHDSIRTSPDESNLKLDVILASLSINVILLCQYL
jgi:hypothetical protein